MAKIGIGTVAGFGEESGWGTEAARSVWMRVESVDLAPKTEYVQPAVLLGIASSAMRNESIIAKQVLTGTIRGPMSYRGMGILLKHALGAVADTGSNPYTHAYTHTIAMLTGLTVEAIRGSTGNSEEILGARISKLTLEVDANNYMTWEAEFIAKTANARASAGSPTLTTPYTVMGHHCPNASWNSTTTRIKKVKVTINNGLVPVAELGSLYTAEPERGDMLSVEAEVELYATSEALYTAHHAGTSSNLVLTFTEPVTSETLTITLHAAKVVEYADPITTAGLLTARAKFRAHPSGSDRGIAITTVNAQATGIE